MQIKKIPFLFFMLLCAGIVNAQMVLEYDIITPNTTIILPFEGSVNVQIDWGDGSAVESATLPRREKLHTYTSIGIKTVTITGSLTQFGSYTIFNNTGNERLLRVLSWDGLGLTSLSNAFYNAFILEQVPASLPSTVTNLSSMFYGAAIFNQPIGNWNTAAVKDMSRMFYGARAFNQPIGNWNTAAVMYMSEMFNSASAFNQPLDTWNTTSVRNMSKMFSYAASFNQPIGSWNTSNVTNMNGMFYYASAFNQPIGDWNTAAVQNMAGMFYNVKLFNQPIGNWNTAAVTDMNGMFLSASAFNQPIGTWNTTAVTDMNRMFSGASAFDQPIGSWNTVAVKNMNRMFADASVFNQPIGTWNTTLVSDMSSMFSSAVLFNQSIDSWNTSSVVNMDDMFSNASAFNQPLENWNTSAVTSMSNMFYYASAFNHPIGNWNTASVKSMYRMFYAASAFDQPIGNWNTASVTTMYGMFYAASVFNQPIGSWNTAAVKNMEVLFLSAKAFNQPIGNWNTASVTTMYGMFSGALVFNQPIGTWNTAAVTTMASMFEGASAFNQPIGGWNTISVTAMPRMFYKASAFNQPIGNWNTSNVRFIQNMFGYASAFNRPIESWDISTVTHMSNMFENATAFNQPLGNWNVAAVFYMDNIFLNAGLCTYNYDITLIGWSIQTGRPLNFNGGSSKYSTLGANARAALIAKGWRITDGGQGLTSGAKCADTSYYNTIRGTIYTDGNTDCIKQASETPLSGIMVKAMPGAYYGYTDSNGNYEVRVDTGAVAYTLTQQYNAANSIVLVNQCASSHLVVLKGASIDTASFDFANEVRACTLPTVDIQHMQLVRCFKSSAYVEYCNLGNAVMNNAGIKVEYPAYLIPISSVPMWSSKVGSVLFYDVAALADVTCGQIKIIDSVDCSSQAVLGLTQCIKVSITPGSTCTSQSSFWDFSSTEVLGTCENNQAAFVLTNTGDGDMSDSLAYRIFLNDTLIYNGKYKLLSGSTLNVRYPAQAQTVRLEADQHPNHPGNSHPKAIVERCGVSPTGFVPKELVTTTSLDDLDEEISIVCYPIRGSFDPNDKQAEPVGVGSAKQVTPGTELEYTIRFQNTGTASATTVRVVDTLDTIFDAGSFVEGVSSHLYTLKITGKGQAVLTFTFNNINLPDSTTNKLGSNGLVSFRITIPSDAALGTVIHNKAYIYFDYNDPILTNNTMHTVSITTVADLSKGRNVFVGNLTTGVLCNQYANAVKLYPNPSDGIVTVEMTESGSNMELRISSVTGVLRKTIKLSNTTKQQVNFGDIDQGMYLYEIWKDGERSSVGKIQIR